MNRRVTGRIAHIELIGLALLSAMPVRSVATAATPEADTVLTNARVYTVDEAQPWAEALAIRDGRIVAVGSIDAVRAHIGPSTQVRDFAGRMILPGFVNAHDHPILGPTVQMGVSLDGVLDIDEAITRIRQFAASNQGAPIVRGHGWSPVMFGTEGPTRAALDRAVPDRPAVLFDHDTHTVWMNSPAIRKSGIQTRARTHTALQPYYSWTADGEPAGAAFEPQGIYPVLDALGWVQWPATVMDAIERSIARAPEVGITTIYDAGIMLPGREDPVGDAFGLLQDLEREQRLPVRVTGSVIANPGATGALVVQELQRLSQLRGSHLLSIRTIKVYLDGVTTYSTGQTIHPYADGSRGLRYFEDGQLDDIVSHADREGLTVHFHVDGDGAARQALDSLGRVRAANGGALKGRHTLCHLTLVDPADIPRFAEMNVTVNTTPVWMSNVDGWFDHMERLLPKTTVQQAFPLRALLQHGTRITFGSDVPSSSLEDMAPLRQIQYAVTRRPIEASGRPYGPLLPGVLTVAEAVRAYTLAAAYQLGIDDQVGSIEVGKLADLTVLGRDLFAEPLQTLHTVPIVLTMLEGRVTFDAR